ncbi:MAG: DUF1640 domain-containing protein [Bacteroidetes bacterium]|nr:DUF1640 domain-containing protein [Bacteroidota bacterium]
MINTLAIAHKLSSSGFDNQQAEALTNVFADVTEEQQQDLATKDFVVSQIQTVRGEISELRGDMNTMGSNLRGEISELRGDMNTMGGNLRGEISELRGDMNTMGSNLRGDMNTKISALEIRLVRWMVVTFFSGMGILFAALRLFPG